MNAPQNLEKKPAGSPKISRRFGFKLVAGLASACLGVGLLLPVIKGGFWHNQRVPRGQFQADMRTMVAEVRYLFTPELDFQKPTPQFDARPVTFEQSAAEQNAGQAHAGAMTNAPTTI